MATDQSTRKSWIQQTPGVQGGDPCIRDTRITVHGLVEWRKLGVTDGELLRDVAGLTQADLEEAWLYYAGHREQIDDIIRQHEEA
jgi:uncharacterized protein (DUF433 family)